MICRLIWAFILSVVFMNAVAEEVQSAMHAVGWNWYTVSAPDTKSTEAMSDPVAQMASLQATLKTALYEAILHPSIEHVAAYLHLQHRILSQANAFESVWQQVLLQEPTLDYSLKHPVNQVGSALYHDEKREKEDRRLSAFAKRYGFFFFYRSTCPYCQRFSPILRRWSLRYHLPLLPITVDGKSVSDFPESVVDHGQARAFQVKRVPALFVVNPMTHQAIPVAYGLLSESELRERVLNIEQKLMGERQ